MSRAHALQVFRAALKAADPELSVRRHLRLDGDTLKVAGRKYPLNRFDRIHLIGAGKASAAMARAVARVLGRRVTSGFVNVQDGINETLRQVELHACGHPVPDERGVTGGQRVLEIARSAGPRDLLLCLISGGASALMPAPSPQLTLAQKQEITRRLLACGATIHEINTVRKHLSQIKGGQLAKLAWPATVIALILSDVIGDDLDVIGSGPTVPDRSTVADAETILTKYGLPSVPFHETPKPADPYFDRVQNVIVGSNREAIQAAAIRARALGYRTLVLSTFIEGETREIGCMHAAIMKEILATGRPARPPACILSGGETTVTLRGGGLGGRNQEFVLAAAIALSGAGPATIFSAGTDGADGPTDAAGAVADEQTLDRARKLDLDPRGFLADNDSYHFFEKVGGLVKTGPTGTNVMDVRILLVPD